MKSLTRKLVVPLTLVSFVCITQWWYVLPLDARQTFYWGFPFAFVGEAWHTSGGLQFFIAEFLFDLLLYFFFWWTVIFALWKVRPFSALPKWTGRLLLVSAVFSCAIAVAILSISHPIVYLHRNYPWEVIDSGPLFIGQSTADCLVKSSGADILNENPEHLIP